MKKRKATEILCCSPVFFVLFFSVGNAFMLTIGLENKCGKAKTTGMAMLWR